MRTMLGQPWLAECMPIAVVLLEQTKSAELNQPLKLAAGTCNATMLPNGDFEHDRNMQTNTLKGWAKIKENA